MDEQPEQAPEGLGSLLQLGATAEVIPAGEPDQEQDMEDETP